MARCRPVSELSCSISCCGVPSKTIAAAVVAGARAHVDHPVGARDHLGVVLDHDHRRAAVDQPVEQRDEAVDVVHVQAGRRLVEDDRLRARVELVGQLEPLALAAGERGERLAEREVAEADVADRLQALADRLLGEELERRVGLHVVDVGDARVAQGVLEHLVGEAPALAALADADHGVEVHEVGVDDAEALAVRARALGVRAEERGGDLVGVGEGLADRRPACRCRWRGSSGGCRC